ncbi:unnamed protein product [Oikopleura dioica]|uniref:Uncharacterized protein n=1 Tax=Oikopleura dioica TaxID=34765 RepID=E4XVP0_OIKDI|nr:unnamed protein product [Oikopleura dioica]
MNGNIWIEHITISGLEIMKEAPNLKRSRKKLMMRLEKRRTDASCKARTTGRDNGSNMKKLIIMVLFDSILHFCK